MIVRALSNGLFQRSSLCNNLSSLIIRNRATPLRNRSADSTSSATFKERIMNGPSLQDFINPEKGKVKQHLPANEPPLSPSVLSLITDPLPGAGRKVFIETYGCQMNSSDSEVVLSIMKNAGYDVSSSPREADVIFVNTCAIRENAEDKVWRRLAELKALKGGKGTKHARRKGLQIGVLGCMAERLKDQLLEKSDVVDIVVGPDAYRDIPNLLRTASSDGGSARAMNVQLSLDETYADIAPVRPAGTTSAYISIMRGCDNMCSYCIVPFTRGRERSRSASTIFDEVKQLAESGVKEIVLLGQNVNSYNDLSWNAEAAPQLITTATGFRTIYRPKKHTGMRFADLLHRSAAIAPEVRFRFTSPHPKDFPPEVLDAIAELPNICKSIHVPAQSGSSAVLDRMRRGYSRESYLQLVREIRSRMPTVALSSDFISGFCGETDQDHQDTLSLLREVVFDQAFMFAYSLREKTHAHRNYTDDVPPEVKNQRLKEVIDTFHELAKAKNQKEIGTEHIVLVEGPSRRSASELSGRTDTNKVVVFPDIPVADGTSDDSMKPQAKLQPGDYVRVRITSASNVSLRAEPQEKTSIARFFMQS